MNKWNIVEVENGFIFQEGEGRSGFIEKIYVFNSSKELGDFIASKLAKPETPPNFVPPLAPQYK